MGLVNNTRHLERGLLRRAKLKTFVDEDAEVALAYVRGHFRSELGGDDWPLHRRALRAEREEKHTEIVCYRSTSQSNAFLFAFFVWADFRFSRSYDSY